MLPKFFKLDRNYSYFGFIIALLLNCKKEFVDWDMRKSKLEIYEVILAALSLRSQTLDSLAFSLKMDCVNLADRLDFLRKNNLVEEKTCNKKQFYTLTRRGGSIEKTLAIAKRLEQLQTTPERAVTFATFIDKDEEKVRSR